MHHLSGTDTVRQQQRQWSGSEQREILPEVDNYYIPSLSRPLIEDYKIGGLYVWNLTSSAICLSAIMSILKLQLKIRL